MSKFLIVLCGKSGCGKTTIASLLQEKYNLKVIQSYTTRPPRYKNEEGHIFISKEEFDNLKDYVAYTKFNDYEYCATAQQVEENDIYVVDPNGIEFFYNHYKGQKIPIVFQIKATPFNLIRNMRHRGDKWKQIISRVKNDKKMFENIDELTRYTVFNNTTPQNCAQEIYKYCEIFCRQRKENNEDESYLTFLS